MDKKKEEVYQHLVQHTAKHLQQKGGLGRDALNISIDLQMDRSNVSRLLNQLHHEGRLIKTQGRPTLFFARTPLENEYPDVHVPSIIPKGKSIHSYLKEELEQKNELTQADV
ncbi:MAG: sugar transporter, partial [Clostridium sp.]